MEKIVVIAGGDGNIARATIRKYLSKGSRVIALDVKEKSEVKEFYDNPNYEYFSADVTNIQQLTKVYHSIEEKYNRITHLISATGHPIGTEKENFEVATIEDINQSIQLNLNSHIYVTKIFLPLLKNETIKEKSVTMISSINALKTFNLPAYSAAKAGIYGFMYSVARELGQYGIRINTISPGTVPTPEELNSGDSFYNYRYKTMLALEDFTKPEDVADAIYSITHFMKAVTGQNIVVDSGQTI